MKIRHPISRALLELAGITKVFPGVTALDNIDLSVAARRGAGPYRRKRRRQIHPDENPRRRRKADIRGIRIDGHDRGAHRNGIDARRHRFRPPGTQPVRQSRRRRQCLYRPRTADLRLGQPQTPARTSGAIARSSGCRFRSRHGRGRACRSPSDSSVEIAKALSIDARIIIMDEPTSSLTLQETERLLRVIADLRAQGVSIIYISHRLAEVKRAPIGWSACGTGGRRPARAPRNDHAP